jgi:hypothetical protein
MTNIPWWNNHYAFRKQITVNAGSAIVPVGYPVKVTENTASIYAAGKCLSDYKDVRIVRWAAGAFTELFRDRVADASLIFSIQAEIAASGNDASYWIYYGYLGETTTKQPSSNSEWLKAYAIFGETPDANSKSIWIPDNDITTWPDRLNSHNATINNYDSTATRGLKTDAPMGRNFRFDIADSGTPMYGEIGNVADLDGYSGFTVEALVKAGNADSIIISKWQQDDLNSQNQWEAMVSYNGASMSIAQTDSNQPGVGSSSVDMHSTWHWVAMVYHAGSKYDAIYIDGNQNGYRTSQVSGVLRQPSTGIQIGQIRQPRYQARADISIIRFSNTPRTSFPYCTCFSNPPTLSMGAEERVYDLSQGGII